SWSTGLLLHVFVDELHDVLRVRTRAEDRAETEFRQRRGVLFRDDATAEQQDVFDAALLQLLDNPGKQLQVRSGEDAEPNDVDIFLQGRFGDHLRCLPDAGVDDFAAGITQGADHDFRAGVMPIAAGLGDEDANLRGGGGRSHRFPLRYVSVRASLPAPRL